MSKVIARTFNYPGDARYMHVHVGIRPVGSKGDFCWFRAVWDTGAECSCLTKSGADLAGIRVSGSALSGSATEVKEVNCYDVDICLYGGYVVENVKVREVMQGDFDMLLGMDIIRHCDFAVTHQNGQLVLTYQVPPTHTHDYEKENAPR